DGDLPRRPHRPAAAGRGGARARPPRGFVPGGSGLMTTIAVFDLDRTVTTHATFTPWLLRFLKRHPQRVLAVPVILAAALAYKLKLVSRKGLKQIMLKAIVRGLPAAEVAAVTADFVADWV